MTRNNATASLLLPIVAAASIGTAPPTLRYASAARYSPRGISRGVDSLTRPPLKKADLVWTDDPACTYSRTLRFDPTSGTYRPDVPLPACDQYTK
jgi:hypothetical protein